MALPNDPIMLLSVVNLKLRDFYKTSMLCAKTWMPTRQICAQSSKLWATSTMPSATSSCDISRESFLLIANDRHQRAATAPGPVNIETRSA